MVALTFLAIVANPVRSFLGNLDNFSLDTQGVKLKAERTKHQVAVAISGAYQQKELREGPSAPQGSQDTIDRAVEKVAGAQAGQRLKDALILWVDDHPENNVLERRAMEALGVRFTNVTSNEIAQDVLHNSRYDLVISDLSRDGDGCDNLASPADCDKCQALRLLDWMKGARQIELPSIIYYTSQDKAKVCRDPIRKKGAFGVTGEPGELLDLVTRGMPRWVLTEMFVQA
jgi:CheY-like chemotaxis protein